MKTHSSTQDPISLSSGEAEFYGLVKTAAGGLGFVSLYRDWGLSIALRCWTDSSSAKGTSTRRGAGRIRHIETSTLWLQTAVTQKRLSIHKIAGPQNPADLGTKHLSGERLWMLLGLLDIVRAEGSSHLALAAEVGT